MFTDKERLDWVQANLQRDTIFVQDGKETGAKAKAWVIAATDPNNNLSLREVIDSMMTQSFH